MNDKIQNLRDKIRKFIQDVIIFARTLPNDDIGRIFLKQIIRSATSIGANFEESTEAESNKDVIHKMSIVRKETKETLYWLEIIGSTFPALDIKTQGLKAECLELVRIFASIINKRRSPPNT
jgi:four helix bundle protein